MERRRRWLASLLALVLAVGLLPTAAWASGEVDNSVEDTEQITETEVETGSTAAEFLSDNTAVDSTGNVTRAQMAEMVYEHESLKKDIDSMAYGGSDPNFTDITVSENGVTQDQHDAIIALYKAQIINGTSEATFAPGGQVTRNEFAVVLWRATGCRSNNTAMEQTLSDVALWAEAAVNCFFGAGLVKGDTSNDFRGSVPITVAEVNAFLTAYQTNRETFIASTKEGATSRAAMTVEFYHEFQSQLSSLPVTRQWESDGPFTDLFGCTDEQIEAIRFFYLRGIIDGTTDTTFHPLTPVTNFMVATLLQRCAEAPESLTTTPDTQSVSLLNVMPLSENEGNLGAAFQFLIDNGADENSVRAADANENAPALTSDLTNWIGGLTPGRPMITINGDTVTITADTDADIYYTTDGNPPTSGSTPYSSTFRLTASATVRAVAVKNNLVSDVAQATYTAPVLTITPSPTSLTGGGTVTLTVSNIPAGATGVTVICTSHPTIAVSGSGTAWTATLPNADATYTFIVTAETATDTCTVTVTRRSTSSSSSSSNTTTSTERNPDGSTTTTTTNKTTGTVTETTRYPDGSREVVETKRDGTVTTTSTDADGNQTTVVENPDGSMETTVDNADGTASVTTEDPDGRVTVEAVLPASAVNDAGGEAVALPMPAVRAERDRGDAPTVTVDLPRGASVPVEIPVENAATSTVALLVHADGTEEIVKTSLATEDGVTVSLSDGDTVKIVDNGKTFYDVPGSHWGAEAIDFVTSRELFGGTSAVTFEPERSMNRGMLVTVLYRLENEPNVWGGGSYTDVPEGMYYSSAVAWADGNGIVTGYADATFAPGRDITREEMAVVLYRYARYKGLDVAASTDLGRYTDAGSISVYAQQAMAWANAHGLITADTTGALTPRGYATRAQVAAILQRFLYLMDG